MLGIITPQIDVMKQFYIEVLGFRPTIEMDSFVEFENDGVRFVLSTTKVMDQTTGHPSYRTPRQGQSLELAFRVDTPAAVDEEYQTLIEKGATPITPPADMPWGQRAAFFADPDGNIHEVFMDLKTS